MFAGGNANFAVVYSDGDREVNVGTIDVDPAAVTFKHLLTLLSRKIGISPHHFSVYLAAVGSDRKIPITAKVDLATAMHLDGRGAAAYYFFIVKRTSSRRSKKAAAHPPPAPVASQRKKIPPENVMLLRRAAGESQLAAFSAAAAGAVPPFMDRVEFEMRMMNLRMERERFLMNMAMKDASVAREASNGGADGVERNSGGGGGGGILICEECLRAKTTGTDDGAFHPCVYDEVTVGFRSPAGPISRPPAKNSGEERP